MTKQLSFSELYKDDSVEVTLSDGQKKIRIKTESGLEFAIGVHQNHIEINAYNLQEWGAPSIQHSSSNQFRCGYLPGFDNLQVKAMQVQDDIARKRAKQVDEAVKAANKKE